MKQHRFCKSAALEALDHRAAQIAAREGFNRSHGTAQLRISKFGDAAEHELIRRAVEYGRMRAFEEFACAIEEGFKFEQLRASKEAV